MTLVLSISYQAMVIAIILHSQHIYIEIECTYLIINLFRKTKKSLTGWSDNTIIKSGNGFHLIVFVVFPAKKLSSSFIIISGRSSGIQ